MQYGNVNGQCSPGFLKRGCQGIKDVYAAYGRKLKAAPLPGDVTERDKDAYKELQEWVRMFKTLQRHAEWYRTYCAAYDQELENAYCDGLLEHQAKKQALIKSEELVVAKFSEQVTTTQSVRRALKDYLSA